MQRILRNSVWALTIVAMVGCQSSGSSTSWRWPWSKAPAREPVARSTRGLDDSADAIYGGRDPLLSGSPNVPAPSAVRNNRAGLDEPLKLSDPPTLPAAASTKKPFLALSKPKWMD